MKNQNLTTTFATLLALLLVNIKAFAQLDVDIDLGGTHWYEDPKVWVGAAVFLLIVAFIARGGKK